MMMMMTMIVHLSTKSVANIADGRQQFNDAARLHHTGQGRAYLRR